MKRVPLVEYEMPRILAIDFKIAEVDRLRNEGFNVLRGATGVLPADRGEFNIPCSVTDVEILLFGIKKGGLQARDRQAQQGSIEERPCFYTLVEEVWGKDGFVVFFVDDDVSPLDFDLVGIKNIGVIDVGRKYFAARFLEDMNKELGDKKSMVSGPKFTMYKGQSIGINKGIVPEIYQKFISSAKHTIFSVENDLLLFDYEADKYPYSTSWHVVDESTNTGALCIEIKKSGVDTGSILILPSFQGKNIDVSIALIKEYFNSKNPMIFSKPDHQWLSEYKPYTVQQLELKRDDFVQEAIKKAEEYGKQIEEQQALYSWLDNLLVGRDDEFAEAVMMALRFLEFIDVIDVDKLPDTGNRKREDFRIHDADGYFALGEAKSTERGSNQKMISDLQSHQLRYSKEFQDPGVLGLLFVNHSLKQHPNQRHDFYKADDLQEKLQDSSITAIASVFLHSLCQRVLSEEIDKESARTILKSGQPVLQ